MKDSVLIVEDEKIIALDLQYRLEKYGFRVVDTVTTAGEAVAAAEAYAPDIILMDIKLGGGSDGISAAKTVKSRFRIPVVFITSFADENTLAKAKEAEPFGYILKPFKEKELLTTVEIALYKHRIDRKLFLQERWYSSILQSSGDGIIAADTEGKVRFMNPAAEALTGWIEADARDRDLAGVLDLRNDDSGAAPALPGLEGLESCAPFHFERSHILSRQGARIPVEGNVARIVDADRSLLGRVVAFRDVSDLRRMAETISYQAEYDALTGLLNRKEFLGRMETLLRDGGRGGGPHSFIMLDLDRFRVVNDLCGHAGGDEALRRTAENIRTAVPPRDSVVGRLGGDEFGVLLSGTTPEAAGQIARGLLAKVRTNSPQCKTGVRITASIGVVPAAGSAGGIYGILAAADAACFLAKEEGGDRIKTYTPEDGRLAQLRGEMRWITRLTRALEDNLFRLYCQPIRALKSGLPDKIEILLRLVEPGGQVVPPSEFLPAAERYGFMPAVDRWVLREAVRNLGGRLGGGGDAGSVFCVNLSAFSLADESLRDYIAGLLADHGIPGGRLCLEITETAAIENLSRARNFMLGLKDKGVTFALDDFGNGFSSFANLKNLPVDFLKIDGSYVKDIIDNPVDAALVEAVNAVGHAMGVRTIAEFVHNRPVLEALARMGVDYGQGYGIAAPAPLPDGEEVPGSR